MNTTAADNSFDFSLFNLLDRTYRLEVFSVLFFLVTSLVVQILHSYRTWIWMPFKIVSFRISRSKMIMINTMFDFE